MAVSGAPGVKVPVADDVLSSHEHEIYTTTSVDENSIQFEFQTDRKTYVDLRQTYLAPKIKLFKGRGFDSYKTTEKKKEHKEDTVSTETGEDDVQFIEEVKECLKLLMRTIFCIAFFLMQTWTLTTTKSTIRTDFMLANLTSL